MTLERIANRRENVSIFNEYICTKYDKLELAFSIRKQFRNDNLGKIHRMSQVFMRHKLYPINIGILITNLQLLLLIEFQ